MPIAIADGMFTISTQSKKTLREVQNTKAVADATGHGGNF